MSSSMEVTTSTLKSCICSPEEAGSVSELMPTAGSDSSSSMLSCEPAASSRPLNSSSAGIFLPFRSPMPSERNLPMMLSPSFLPTLNISAMPAMLRTCSSASVAALSAALPSVLTMYCATRSCTMGLDTTRLASMRLMA